MCLSPIVLKNGLCVPCGKCDICRSNARNEWSIRLAIHLANCDRMPMFITLTYNDDCVPRYCEKGYYKRREWPIWNTYDSPDDYFNTLGLDRCDVSRFLKKYKRKYGLTNDKFQYFGCGELGETTRRPHYHLLFFGDKELYNLFFQSTEDAQKRIADVWCMGNVHIGLAGFDGIHYVTKYVLKDDWDSIPSFVPKPFTIASNGLGMNFLDSDIGNKIKLQLAYCQKHKDEILENVPYFNQFSLDSIKDAIDYLKSVTPQFKVILDDGRKVFLPRAIRKKLVGSFEHFKDSPFWLLTHLQQLYDSIIYYRDYGEYDLQHDVNASLQQCLSRVEKIRKRYLENKYNNKIKIL